MTAKQCKKSSCEACQVQNVQVQPYPLGLGQNGFKLSLRIASGHNIHSLCEIVSKCYGKCPSPCPSPGECPCPSPGPAPSICPSPITGNRISWEGYEMERDFTMIWLPLARVAELTGKSIKTIRRLVKEGNLPAVNRLVPSGKSHTTKTFVLAAGELLDLEIADCKSKNQHGVCLDRELMNMGSDKRDCRFVTAYIKVGDKEE